MAKRLGVVWRIMISGALCAVIAHAEANEPELRNGTAITQVYGDGIRLVSVGIQSAVPVRSEALDVSDFSVEGRHITSVYASRSLDPATKAATGNYIIINLSPADASAKLAQHLTMKGQPGPGGQGGPGKAGSIPAYDTVYRKPQVTFTQLKNIQTTSGSVLAADGLAHQTDAVKNRIVDEFQQRVFHDEKTGKTLKYNLYIPKNYNHKHHYPLVLFMHDAGATSDVVRTTLYQGLGAVSWANPDFQKDHPAFVLAPQYQEIIADDDSKTSAMLDTTIDLIHDLSGKYSIDANRRYTTGQSGGCMMSIAMDIKYPHFFAASLLVAGQWSPKLVKPLMNQKLWVMVSADDSKAWPGENAMMSVLEKQGAKITRAEWDGRWNPVEMDSAFEQMDREHTPINYVVFKPGTVIPAGESTAHASGHRNTWRIAYTIPSVKEWIFRQHR